MNTQIENPREVKVEMPARIRMMQDAKINSISLAQMIDPLTQSEICRIEERLTEMQKALSLATRFIEEFESYKKVVKDLAAEVGILHKTTIFRGTTRRNPVLVVSAVASAFGIYPKQIMSRARPQHIAIARMVAMYIIRVKLGSTLQQTGEFFKKDHGTVLHAYNTIKKLMSEECPKESILGMGRKAFASKVKAIAEQFKDAGV